MTVAALVAAQNPAYRPACEPLFISYSFITTESAARESLHPGKRMPAKVA